MGACYGLADQTCQPFLERDNGGRILYYTYRQFNVRQDAGGLSTVNYKVMLGLTQANINEAVNEKIT